MSVKQGTYIHNVILMSSPSGKNSELIDSLKKHENIGAVHIINPEDDLLSDAGDIISLARGAIQNLQEGDDAPHMDQIRPGVETWNRLIEIVEQLRNKGVR